MDGERIKKRHIAGVLVTGLLVGICLGGSWLCRTQFVLQMTQRFAKQIMAQQFDCCFDANIESVSLLQSTVVCRRITVTPICGQANWHWCCDYLKIHFSLASILFLRCVQVFIDCDGLDLHSQMKQNKPAIIDHIKRIIASPDMLIPIKLRRLHIRNGWAHIYDVGHAVRACAGFDLLLNKNGPIINTDVHVRNGQINRSDATILNNIQGHIIASGLDDKNLSGQMKLCASCMALPEPNNVFCFEGKLTDATIKGCVHNTTGTVAIDPLTVGMQNQNLYAHAYIKASDICLKTMRICGPLYFDVNLQGALITVKGAVVAPYTGQLEVVGEYNARTDTGTLSCCNNQNFVLKLPDLNVQAKQLILTIERSQGSTVARVRAQAQHNTRKLDVRLCLADNGVLTGFGNCGLYTSRLQAQLWPHMSIDNFQIFDRHKKCVCQLSAHYDELPHFELTGQAVYLWPFVPAKYACYLRGDGSLRIAGTWKDQAANLDLSFERGSISIPYTGNMLTDCHAHVTIAKNPLTIQVRDLNIELDQGRLECGCANLYFDDQLQPIFVHVPLIASKLLASVFGLAARASAGLLVTKSLQASQITVGGAIFIDKAVANLAAFSETYPNLFFPAFGMAQLPIDYQLVVQTRGPVSVKTPTLQADTCVRLRLNGTYAAPVLKGIVRFESGFIHFPHAALAIDRGALYFTGRYDDGVRLDLHAHGLVQNYRIYLRASGLPEQPVIQLSSSPELSQERIASLLVAGSSQQMLNSVALAVVLDGVRHTFESMHVRNGKSSVFAQSLKKVRLAPRIAFSENGALIGGGLALDWDDRLQATVCKNFSFKNDTSFEVDYQLADEIKLKAFSDQHGGVGGQLQMRLKF